VPGGGTDHPPPSSAEVKERIELYLYSPSGPSWLLLGCSLPLFYFICILKLNRFLKVFANRYKTAITTCNKNKRLYKVKCIVEVR
jgi:hypothetical protein